MPATALEDYNFKRSKYYQKKQDYMWIERNQSQAKVTSLSGIPIR